MKRIELDWKWLGKFLGNTDKKYTIRGYKKEEVKLLYDLADVRYKAIILALATSGMRRTGLADLDWDDFEFFNISKSDIPKELFNDLKYLIGQEMCRITVYRNSKHEHYTFCTPEATKAIRTYQKSVPEQKKFLKIKNTTISMDMMALAEKAGLTREHGTDSKHRNSIPAVHGLKKYAISAMKKARVNTESRKMMTDHSIGVDEDYIEDVQETLLQEYIKAIPFLTIYEQVVVIESDKEVADLKRQLAEQQEIINQVGKILPNLWKIVEKDKQIVADARDYYDSGIDITDEELEVIKNLRKAEPAKQAKASNKEAEGQ